MSALDTLGTKPFTIHVAILAGGKSSRMGCDKRFLDINGESILDRAIRISETWQGRSSGRVFLSGSIEGYSCLKDRISGMGPLGGLDSVIQEIRKNPVSENTWLLLLPVDMPNLCHSLFDELASDLRSAASEISPFGAIRYLGFELPCLFRLAPKLDEAVKESLREEAARLRSVRGLLAALRVKEISLTPELAGCMENVNTPDDYARVRRAI